MAEPEKLTIRDAENAQKGILALALAYPDYPKLFKACLLYTSDAADE